ncbi:MAG: glycoside hydrolase family 5 protein [Planctomycetota bacterium]|jgi:aryl-phospho-beta-D-glucosidase BglC (GH1 family)
MMTTRACRIPLVFALCLAGRVVANGASPAPDALPRPTPEQLPRWRGFNLTEKFHRDWSNGPFVEEDFRLIHELGFNFVRLPMDYRVWTVGDDWDRFHEPALEEIDRAVAWGERYGIHVCINFHRAPGYTVATPPEARDLWTDSEAQRVCAEHWATFARRYRGIPNERLSFNLFNEPSELEAAAYVPVVRVVVAAIRKEDPDRLIISDGLQWGTRPVMELGGLKIAQATRGYTPSELTHYRASWMHGADQFPLPTWPIVAACGMLYGSSKPELQAPMVIDGPFARPTRLRLRVGSVSSRCLLIVDADGTPVLEKDFVCGPGEGEWKKAEYRPEWGIYQNVYDRDYEAVIPRGTRRVRVRGTEGDWMSLGELGLRAEGDASETVLALRNPWGEKPAQLRYETRLGKAIVTGAEHLDRQWLKDTMIRPWKEAQAKGIGVMVGEFGAFNQTPHEVTLAWMEDCLKNWQEAGWGWALWNFRGSFGVLDSDRKDVAYEDFRGHKLDRKMLDLLQRY